MVVYGQVVVCLDQIILLLNRMLARWGVQPLVVELSVEAFTTLAVLLSRPCWESIYQRARALCKNLLTFGVDPHPALSLLLQL